jgi:hypothetical protein
MSFLHRRRLASTRLLAANALEGVEKETAESHLATCSECRHEFEALSRVLRLLEQDPLHETPGISLAALKARVEARLVQRKRPSLVPSFAAVGAVLLAVLSLPRIPERAELPSEALDSLERTLTREETARYLASAQDVLVTVATPSRCRLGAGHVDVEQESERSRKLLEKRTLLAGGDVLPSAKPVLDDVEQVLREVASLKPCATRSELEAIHREVSERQLLLRIDLMTQELAG